jgi:hypothetical protein
MRSHHAETLIKQAFVRWVTLAGGSVRGVGNAGLHSLKALNDNTATATATLSTSSMPQQQQQQQQQSVSLLDMSVVQPDTTSTTTAMQTLSEADISQNDSDEYHDLWPLQLIDLKDEDMIGTLYRLLRHLPQVIEYYLDTYIFPETMEHQGLKLAANGQDVGGDMLFKTKLGFSGTPSDLLPVELGRCQFEMGNTAMMLHYLTDTQVKHTHMLTICILSRDMCMSVQVCAVLYSCLQDDAYLVVRHISHLDNCSNIASASLCSL